jgi:hypothetical protein
MIATVLGHLKQNQKLRSIYRELYYSWKELSVILFVFWLKQSKFKAITRDGLLKKAQKYNLQKFGTQESVNFGDFLTIGAIPANIAQKIYPMQVEIVEPFVCEIADAVVIGSTPIAFDREGNLILETTLPRFTNIEAHIAKNVSIKTLLSHQFDRSKPKKPPIEIASIFNNPWSSNFWHWTVDTLTQLEGIEYYREQTGIKPKLIVPQKMRSWQKDSLTLLGYGEEDWIIWQESKRLVKKLIVPSFRRSYKEIHGEISVTACQWLRQTILSNLAKSESQDLTFSPNVFISRRKALGRRITNEEEVIEALTQLGFTTYLLEDMSYVDQVRLFAQAKVIVAPHGAGLTNLLFAENARIVELFGAYVGREFANLSRGLSFKYGCLGCEPPRGEMRQKEGDMIVDVKKLLALLDKMNN